MAKRQRRQVTRALMLGLLLVFFAWIIWTNTHVGVTHYAIEADIPEAFDGFVIAHVSDLHNHKWGKQLTNLLVEARPDLIAVTGDLVSYDDTDYETALAFIHEAVAIAPVYYTTGNHESEFVLYPELEDEMITAGVIVLRNESVSLSFADETITSGNETINLIGLDDPEFEDELTDEGQRAVMAETLERDIDESRYNLVLSHRPEEIDTYVEAGADLVLAGHAHGGQIRLPFIGALYAPGQGFFPEYTEGVHDIGSTKLVISRGLGNSVVPFRFNNTPELVIIELQAGRS